MSERFRFVINWQLSLLEKRLKVIIKKSVLKINSLLFVHFSVGENSFSVLCAVWMNINLYCNVNFKLILTIFSLFALRKYRRAWRESHPYIISVIREERKIKKNKKNKSCEEYHRRQGIWKKHAHISFTIQQNPCTCSRRILVNRSRFYSPQLIVELCICCIHTKPTIWIRLHTNSSL